MQQKDGNSLRKTKHCRRRLTVFGTISIVVIVLFIYNLFSYINTINKLEGEEQKLQEELTELRKNNANLKEEIDKLKNPDYLAAYAREKFQYSKNGEIIIRIDENDKVMVEISTDEVEHKQKIVIILLGITLSILFIYIFIKIRKKSLE